MPNPMSCEIHIKREQAVGRAAVMHKSGGTITLYLWEWLLLELRNTRALALRVWNKEFFLDLLKKG